MCKFAMNKIARFWVNGKTLFEIPSERHIYIEKISIYRTSVDIQHLFSAYDNPVLSAPNLTLF